MKSGVSQIIVGNNNTQINSRSVKTKVRLELTKKEHDILFSILSKIYSAIKYTDNNITIRMKPQEYKVFLSLTEKVYEKKTHK